MKTSSYERILTPIFREVKFSLGLMEWEEYSQRRSGCEQGTPNSKTFLEQEKKKKDPRGENEWNTCFLNLALLGLVSQPAMPALRKRDKTSPGKRSFQASHGYWSPNPSTSEMSLLIRSRIHG